MRSVVRQLLMFTFMGCLSAGVDLGVYLGLTRMIDLFSTHYVTASVISATTAVTAGYFNNRRWTFGSGESDSSVSYVRFLGVYGLGIIWQNVIFASLIAVNILDWLAKITAILVVAYAWNFLLAKYWVFHYNRIDITRA